VEVRLSDDTTVVLDAGTGMRAARTALLKAGRYTPVHCCCSHTHWDHVLGLPFFARCIADTHLFVYPLANDAQDCSSATSQRHSFPVSVDDIRRGSS